MRSRRNVLMTVLFVLAAAAPARSEEIPLRNWTPAPYPAASSGGRLTALGDIGTSGLVFVPFSPCRAVDTRNAAGTFGGPKYAGGETRSYDLTASACTGMPGSVQAYSVNITVTETSGPGYITAYPQGAPPVPLVSVLNYVGGQTIANAAVIPTTTNVISVQAANSGSHVIIDVNGYYTFFLNSGEQLYLNTSKAGDGGVYGVNYANAAGSAGVRGYALGGTGGTVAGVLGEVTGTAALNSAGVKGIGHFQTSYATWGVLGETDNVQTPANIGLFGTGGVLGRGDVLGALGIGNYPTPSSLGSRGVVGCVKNSGGSAFQVCGMAGYISADGVTTYGLYATGNTGATGTKSFVEPHPTDPGKVIRYVSLEGPEAGTYFRGSGRTVDGVAVIDVPESFRLVSDTEGLTVQITPKGQHPTATSVESADLSQIVVHTTRDVEFSYLVQGVRRSFRDFAVIVDGTEFRPEGPDATMPSYLAEEQKRSLVRAGVYHEDGTVNLQTAERYGWAAEWRRTARVAGSPR